MTLGAAPREDRIEEIVGAMADEYDAPRGLFRRGASDVVVSARASVAGVNENLPQGGRETPTGLALPEGG